MSDSSSPRAGLVSRGGVAAEHERRVALPVFAAPATAEETNTIRPPLLPIACFRLEDLRFDFDSSFVKAEAAEEMRALASLWRRCGNPPASVFGHADPVGDDGYNKVLSGRRALAIYALLVRRVDIWETLYTQPFGGDSWGARAVQRMLAGVGFDPGPIDGVTGPRTRGAVQAFQSEHGLAVDGIAGPETRRALFTAYMDALCADESGQAFVLAPGDFLGQGADPAGKGDVQGCSEFNPILVLSREESAELSAAGVKAQRDTINTPNRRVVIFLFPPGSRVDPSKWPCPRTSEDASGCRAMFWPDGEARRSPQDTRRTYAIDRSTFACRFYDGMARRSPCEMVRQTLAVRLLDDEKRPLSGAAYELSIGQHELRKGTANEAGWLVEPDVLSPSVCTIRWGGTGVEGSAYELSLRLDAKSGSDDDQAKKRLHNLGYLPALSFTDSVRVFQTEYGVGAGDGNLDGATRARLIDAHDKGIARGE